MAGTFPDNTIFESIEIRSDTNQLTTIDANNKLYGKISGTAVNWASRTVPSVTHAWEFDLSTKPLTRSEMGPILAFLNKQNGSAETFEITPPQTNSRNGDANTDRIFILGTALDKGSIGIIFYIEAPFEDSPDYDSDGGTVQIYPGDFFRFTGHDKVYCWQSEVFTVPCANFDNALVGQNGYFFPPAQQVLSSSAQFQLNPSFKVALINEPMVVETNVDNVFKIKFSVREEPYA
jgi:hypothetical protein